MYVCTSVLKWVRTSRHRNMQTLTHTQVNLHTHTHTNTHMEINTHSETHIHMYTHTNAHTCNKYACMYVCVRVRVLARDCVRVHVCVRARMRVRVCIFIFLLISMYTYVCMYIYKPLHKLVHTLNPGVSINTLRICTKNCWSRWLHLTQTRNRVGARLSKMMT